MTGKMDEFVAKQMKRNAARKLIAESVKGNGAIARAKAEDRALAAELKAQGKAYHPETGEWY
jgi:hypothetical protein